MLLSESKPRVAIVDYQMANMFSVERACEHVGLMPTITAEAGQIADAEAVILPGVGAFGEAMANLNRLGLISAIHDFVASGRPLLGICLGMQLLFSESEEFGAASGLDILPGRVVRFPKMDGDRRVLVPQIGWNQIWPPAHANWTDTPLQRTQPGTYMYFLHSYYVECGEPATSLCVTNYGGVSYTSGVARGNVFGLQFHPEKSSHKGIDIYKAFAAMLTNAKAIAK